MGMDGTLITGIILVTVGVLATMPTLFSWSNGGMLSVTEIVPGVVAQLCGCIIATRTSYDLMSVALIAGAWTSIATAARPLLVPNLTAR